MDHTSLERKFLHDVATPIGSALLLADVLMDSMKSESPDHPDLKQMTDLIAALTAVQHLIEVRRAEVIEEQNKRHAGTKNV